MVFSVAPGTWFKNLYEIVRTPAAAEASDELRKGDAKANRDRNQSYGAGPLPDLHPYRAG